jgi:putative tricarboxylic transport membrane protein
LGAPGITPEQRRDLTTIIEAMVKSPEWAEILKQRGWEDYYLSGESFASFLRDEQARVNDVLKSIGLVK